MSALALAAALQAAAPSSFVNWETPHVHPLELTPSGTRLLAVDLPDARLEVFDVSGGAPVALFSVPVGLDPVSVRTRTEREAWVVNQVSDSISIVDLETRNVVATLATDDEPADVVFVASPARALVSCARPDLLDVFALEPRPHRVGRVPLAGQDPRALARSPDGAWLYAAFFESGNGTTILTGGAGEFALFPNVVNDPLGPWGGLNPPPNSGTRTVPPLAPGLPPPPRVGLIVREDERGRWLDDNRGDWTELVSGSLAAHSGRIPGWRLLDHDVAVLASADLAAPPRPRQGAGPLVSYVPRLMNACMALDVHPLDGRLAVVGTEARNELRYQPRLRGRFLESRLALVDPVSGARRVLDLNPHLAGVRATEPGARAAQRERSVADPRAVRWSPDGSRLFVAGMGSDNVVVLDASGARLGESIRVGRGPTGLAPSADGRRLFVLNKFESSLSTIDLALFREVARLPFHDATPAAIRAGRRHLYDAHATSGSGVGACAGCHVDARTDRLAWDLGDPRGTMEAFADQNRGAGVPGMVAGFEDAHPMKGPMVTQTLQDIVGKEPFHWRGDRDGLEAFGPAFMALLDAEREPDATELQELEDFLASIHFPPAPARTLENELPSALPLPGHYTTGAFAPAGRPLPPGDARRGLALYLPHAGVSCSRCHTLPTGMGTDTRLVDGQFVPLAPGPQGEHHHELIASDGSTSAVMKIPQLRTLPEKDGFALTRRDSTSGFGYTHDGSVDTLERFLFSTNFPAASDQDVADLVAFLLSLSGSDLPSGSPTELLAPPGTASQDTHAAVGQQLTLAGAPGPAESARLARLLALADGEHIGLVCKGRLGGEARGWSYLGARRFQSDRRAERHTVDALLLAAAPGGELTFTAVPRGSAWRLGVDRDEDGALDRDELDAGCDPADPSSRPRVAPR